MRLKPLWGALGGILALVVCGFVLWSLQVQAIDRQIERKRGNLKGLHLGKKLPPNREVVAYFKSRGEAIQTQYDSTLALVAPSVSIDRHVDPQLFFRKRLHEVQRTLERVATARGVAPPVQLGFPKELPPADAVPRFLMQIGLIEEVASLIMAVPGVSELRSFKVGDPEPLGAVEDPQEAFLTRLPVRVQMVCSLEALTRTLGLLSRARPLIDVQNLRVVSLEDSTQLEVECVLARYLLTRPLTNEG